MSSSYYCRQNLVRCRVLYCESQKQKKSHFGNGILEKFRKKLLFVDMKKIIKAINKGHC